jgi:hypothetical protein
MACRLQQIVREVDNAAADAGRERIAASHYEER